MSNPDTVNTLSLDVSASHAVLDSVTSAEAAAFADLCILDGELFSFLTATLTGTDAYNLTTLYRGLYGTAMKYHAQGSIFARLDGAVAKLPYPPNLVGDTVYVKFQSFNQFGLQLQDLSGCTAYPVTLTPQIAVPDTVTGLAMTSWGSSLNLKCDTINRANGYRWDIYKADGVSLIASYTTGSPAFSYTAIQAAADGVQRSYVVRCYAINAGGAGPGMSSGVLSLPALATATVASATVSGGSVVISITEPPSPLLGGFVAYYSPTSGFSPSTAGSLVSSGVSPITIYAASGTYYYRVAAFDLWTSNPSFLNFTTEASFVLTSNGAPPSGGAGGAPGTGFQGGGASHGSIPV